MSASINWIHLSDLHFTSHEAFDRRLILNALLSMLKNQKSSGRAVDLVFITGDIAFSGKSSEYAQAEGFFLRLLETLDLDRSRLILVPGNHDVDRDRIKWLASSPDNSEQCDEYFTNSSDSPHLSMGQKQFIEWHNCFFPESHHFSIAAEANKSILLGINGYKLLIQQFNSAVFSSAKGDQGHLVLGRRVVHDACDAIDVLDSDFRIALMHHPLDWLKEYEQQPLRVRMSATFNIMLRGHLHQTDALQSAGPNGTLLTVAAGATYQTERYPNSMIFGSWDGSRVQLEVYSYSSTPKPAWVKDNSAFPDAHNHIASIQLKGPAEVEFTSNEPRAVIADFNVDLLRDHLLFSPAEVPLYVEPRLMTLPQEQDAFLDAGVTETAKPVTVAEIVASTDSFFVEAFPEYGASLLAARIEAETKARGLKALLLNGPDVPAYKAKIQKHPGLQSNQRYDLVLIDNFDPDEQRRMFIELDGLHIAGRFVLISVPRSDSRRTSSGIIGPLKDFRHVTLWPLGRTEIRALADILFDSSDPSFITLAVDKTYSDLLGLCIPLTPANVIMYLRVLYREENFAPLNRVQIVEQYISEVLRRPSDFYAEAFNARNKLHIISTFASKMYEFEKTTFSHDDWTHFCREYMDAILVQFDAAKLLEDMVNSRLVAKYNGSYWFKYHFFFSYFVGKAISAKQESLEKFIADETYLKLYAAVEVVSGLSSDNTQLIEALSNKVRGLVEAFEAEYIPSSFEPFRELDWVDAEDEEDKVWQPVHQAIEEGPHEPQQLDALKTSRLSEAMTQDQTVRYQRLVDLESKLFVVSALLTEALKNSDEIDGKLKLQALGIICSVEVIALQLGLMLVDEIAVSSFVRWGGVVFVNPYPQNDPDKHDEEIVRVLSVLCSSILRGSLDRLGSKKLGAIFLSLLKSDFRPSFSQVLIFSCVVTTKPANWRANAESFLEALDRRSYYIRICLGVLMRSFKEDICTLREREDLKYLISLVRTKRARKKDAPGSKAVHAVMRMLEDRNLFGVKEK